MGTAAVRRLPLVLLALVLGVPPVISAQAPAQGTVFRSNTQLVRVDAVVVDKDGRPVSGLTKDDFEILDKKTLRPVETLEELAYDRSPARAGAAEPARLTRAGCERARRTRPGRAA